jgi:MoaA/NifB/PqqE/SkfB family radical SAM enzyme
MHTDDPRHHLNNASMSELEFQMANVVIENRPTWMQIEPTVVCNLHCRMCREKEDNVRPGRSADPALFDRIIESGWLKYLSLIEINGWGETFVHRGVGRFLEQCAAHDGLRVQITTNGLLLGDDDLIAALCRLPRMRLVFSIDSPDPDDYEYIRRGASYRRLTDNLDRLNRARADLSSSIETECHCLVNRLNVGRLRVMVDFARRYEFATLSFIPMHNSPDLEVSDDLAVPAMGDAASYARGQGLACNTYSRRALAAEAPLSHVVSGYVWRCPRPWKHIQILSDGAVVPCCYLSSPRSDAVMGNLMRTPLDEIWNSEKYQRLRRSAFQGYPDFCRGESGGCAAKTSFAPNVRLP